MVDRLARTLIRAASLLSPDLMAFPRHGVNREETKIAEPVVALDYEKKHILLHRDSDLDAARAKACSKEPGTVKWIENNVAKGSVFYDIGANIGAYSLLASKINDDHITICSFEPSFSTYGQLVRNVILNGCENSVIPLMMALSAQTMSTVLNYQSIEAGAALHAVGSSVDYKGEEFLPVFTQRLIAYAIDDLVLNYGFASPDSIKIDVDGIEYEILLGAKGVLSQGGVKSLIVEGCTLNNKLDRIMTYLTGVGYRLVEEIPHNDPTIADYVFCRIV